MNIFDLRDTAWFHPCSIADHAGSLCNSGGFRGSSGRIFHFAETQKEDIPSKFHRPYVQPPPFSRCQ